VKKNISLVALLLLYISFSYSQEYPIDKGSVILSGFASIDREGGNPDYDRDFQFTLTPSIGYFVIPKLIVGASIKYTGEFGGTDTYSVLATGPKIQYYFGNSESRNYKFVSTAIHYASSWHDAELSFSGPDISIGVGIILPFNEHIGISLETSYHWMIFKSTGSDSNPFYENKIEFGIGIVGLIY